ncbi:MAG: ASPIC/UnbV domain-containing protein [Acidobacteriaceae bacterium]
MLPSARKAEAAGKQRKSKAVGRAESRSQHASNARRADADAQNHWTSLELHGAKGNLQALNTRVRVTAGELVPEDEVRSRGSYLSQNDLRLHFGFGKHTGADKVEAMWPSGGTETLTGLAVDRFYIVQEGKGVVSTHPAASSPAFAR